MVALQITLIFPLLLQQPVWTGVGLGVSATVAGLVKLPSNILSLGGGPLSGWLSTTIGNRKTMIAGILMISAGWFFAAFYHGDIYVIGFFLCVISFGTTIVYAALPNIIIAATPKDRTSEASGMLSVVRTAFMAIGAQLVAEGLSFDTVIATDGSGAEYPSELAYITLMLVVAGVTSLIAALSLLLSPQTKEERASDLAQGLSHDAHCARQRFRCIAKPMVKNETDSPELAKAAPQMRKGERTRLRIMTETEKILGSRRLKDITVAEIAAMADVSPGTFYNYYKDVTDVVLEAVSRLPVHSPQILDLFNDPWTEADAHMKARQLVEDYVETWDRYRTLFRIRNLAAEEGDVRFIDVRMRSADPLLSAISSYIARLQGDGRMPSEQRPEAIAGALLAMLERIASVMRVYFDPPRQAPEGVSILSDREQMIAATTHILATMLAV